MPHSTLKKIVESGTKLTPMMTQYFSIKEKYPEILLFFRMGDFYELFFEDAALASQLLNITLTHRGKLGDVPIPMAGIPHHSAATYVDKITAQGFKVAICEQVEDPKEAKGIVKRELTRIVGPGIPFDIEKTESSEYRFLSSGAFVHDKFHLVLIDFTTGEFLGVMCEDLREFIDKLSLFSPKEIITFKGQWKEFPEVDDFITNHSILKTYLSEEYFSIDNGALYVEKLIPAYKRDEIIKLHRDILSPVAALSYYICSTQILSEFCHIRPFRMEASKGKMKVALNTLKGLEILPRAKENYKESLLGYMDKTKTSMGRRELKLLFQTPINSFDEIKRRQQIVAFFLQLQQREILPQLRKELGEVRDLDKILTKISTKRATASDLINLSKGILSFEKISSMIMTGDLPALLNMKSEGPEFSGENHLLALAKKILGTINDEIGSSLEKGNLIRRGIFKERDRLEKLSVHSTDEISKLESKYREMTKISNLKIKYNNISGYFIEVSNSHLNKVPKGFERRQTLVNSERFVSRELVDFEKEVITAKEKLEQFEKKIFNSLVEESEVLSSSIMKLTRSLGNIDLFQSLAWVAHQEDFVRPQIDSKKKILHIQGAWHPLIKSVLSDQFVVHNIHLNEKTPFALITGPNMAGKTTVMREMAIIQFLAQIGSFVPAQEAQLGLCDFLFSRLGASDDILKGQSTFMVEMSETAEILRHATGKSLIIMDEVGRGTSTYDGLSIAWALVEHFMDKVKALTLFSTHYHELIEVVERSPLGKNLTVETSIEKGDVQFLYRLIEGGTGQSYGIFVAKLAGLPQSVLQRSQSLLTQLERPTPQETRAMVKGKSGPKKNSLAASPGSLGSTPTTTTVVPTTAPVPAPVVYQEVQLCFFSSEEADVSTSGVNGVVEKNGAVQILKNPAEVIPDYLKNLESDLLKVDVMNLTPLQAMEKLHQLQKAIILYH